MVLTFAQKHDLDKLTQAYLYHEKDKIICFKAPTGFGMSFMASEFISKVFGIEGAQPQKTESVFLTISNVGFSGQLTNKLKQCQEFHLEFTNYEIEFIQSLLNNEKKTILLFSLSKAIIDTRKIRAIMKICANYLNIVIFQNNNEQFKLELNISDSNLTGKNGRFLFLKNQEQIHNNDLYRRVSQYKEVN